MSALWPDVALVEQASYIGPAVLQLIDSEYRWVHRRVERIELLNATQMTRSVATDLTVPAALEAGLGLYQGGDRSAKASRFVLPLGILEKGPLQDVTLVPVDAHRLTAAQTSPLIVAALTPYARLSGAPPAEVLSLARRIVRAETSQPELVRRLERLLDAPTGGDRSARDRLRSLVRTLDEGYMLLVAVKAEPGMPLRVTYVHRQVVEAAAGGVGEPPLVIEAHLPYASGSGPPLSR